MSLLSANEINRIEGYIDREEGLRLATYAALVPADRAIVELGSASGSGALFLASGSRAGLGAHVWAVDPYEQTDEHEIEVYKHPEVRALFMARIAYCELTEAITIVQQKAIEAARVWGLIGEGARERPDLQAPRVGLLHMDALHDFDNTAADFAAWRPYLAPGAYVVFHDVFGKRVGDVLGFIREVMDRDGAFARLELAKWSRYPKRRGQAVYQLGA